MPSCAYTYPLRAHVHNAKRDKNRNCHRRRSSKTEIDKWRRRWLRRYECTSSAPLKHTVLFLFTCVYKTAVYIAAHLSSTNSLRLHRKSNSQNYFPFLELPINKNLKKYILYYIFQKFAVKFIYVLFYFK